KMKIFVWDHNKEISYVRLKEILERKGAEKYVSGCAVHWYTGDHFENLHLIKKHFPEKEIFFTEGCVEYSRLSDASDVQNAEMYAHQMIGNLKGGITAIFDWNLIVDFKGGPNHVGNYCDAPIKALESGKDYEKKLSYYYIGHLTRYIKEGANLIWSSNYTDKLGAAAFLNPDGQRVVVILNKTGEELPVDLREGNESTRLTLASHSIQTVLYE
ncbi:MAG: glucosylceramidase, partial [Butyrivibrio sp.]|nr:glucosylceramidase [Butyrivibrio sp.]